ncbi:MAG: hypothetical protein ABI832_13460 [bacterium]
MKRTKIKIFLKKFILGSAIFSRALTTTLPMASVILPPENAWATARRDFNVSASSPDNATVQAWLKQEIGKRPVTEVVLASYALPGVDRAELDLFWLALAETSRESKIVEAVIAANAKAAEHQGPSTREDFLQQWLVKTTVSCYGDSGHDGCGHGGDDGHDDDGHDDDGHDDDGHGDDGHGGDGHGGDGHDDDGHGGGHGGDGHGDDGHGGGGHGSKRH